MGCGGACGGGCSCGPSVALGHKLTIRATAEEILDTVKQKRLSDTVGSCVVLSQDEYLMLLEAASV